jgi:RNA polymerase sigma factor (sigma-70 family)
MAGFNAAHVQGTAGPRFTTTHWSVVLAARDGDSPQTAEAMQRLAGMYWPPLYAYLRRQGYSEADAQDLTQDFFVHLLARDFLRHLHHQQGKFRSFLLTFLKHFLADQRDKARAQKRGGGKTFISLDAFAAEERQWIEPADSLAPDEIFERRWAQSIMEHALQRLGEEYARDGKGALFEQLKDLPPEGRGALTYVEIGARLNMSETAIKSAVYRLRRRHREIVREEIARTVARPEEVDGEIRHLLTVLAG